MMVGLDDDGPDYPIFRWGGASGNPLVNDDETLNLLAGCALGFRRPALAVALSFLRSPSPGLLAGDDRARQTHRRLETGLCRQLRIRTCAASSERARNAANRIGRLHGGNPMIRWLRRRAHHPA